MKQRISDKGELVILNNQQSQSTAENLYEQKQQQHKSIQSNASSPRRQADAWSELPERLARLAKNLRDHINSEDFQLDQDNLHFQILTKEILSYKEALDNGVVFKRFIEQEDNREVLRMYLQLQLNAIENLKREIGMFLCCHSLTGGNSLCHTQNSQSSLNSLPSAWELLSPPCPSLNALCSSEISQKTPMLSPSPQSTPQTLNQHKNKFILVIQSYIKRLIAISDGYRDLYSQRDNVSIFISTSLSKAKSRLPQTTYSLERLCEIVRQSLQDLRLQISEVTIDEKQQTKVDALNSLKKKYNRIRELPMVQYVVKLFKTISELKTSSFQISKSIQQFDRYIKETKQQSMNLSANSLLLDEGVSRESRDYPINTKDMNILQMSDKKPKSEQCMHINGAITQALVKINKIHTNQLILSQEYSDHKMTSLQDDSTTTATTITQISSSSQISNCRSQLSLWSAERRKQMEQTNLDSNGTHNNINQNIHNNEPINTQEFNPTGEEIHCSVYNLNTNEEQYRTPQLSCHLQKNHVDSVDGEMLFQENDSMPKSDGNHSKNKKEVHKYNNSKKNPKIQTNTKLDNSLPDNTVSTNNDQKDTTAKLRYAKRSCDMDTASTTNQSSFVSEAFSSQLSSSDKYHEGHSKLPDQKCISACNIF